MTKVSHVVVDGSNIATEGRSTPSLAQLEDAVAELRNDLPEAVVIVVVDATFAHRIDETERERFERALLRREYISPPAGAIGRGDAFLLRIAERVDGTVLSNDSFQEFHGEHGWLFDTGRLLGATPVPGVGWIFVPRTPVRGPRSHVAVRDARKAQTKVEKAIAAATKEAVTPAAVAGNGAEPRASKPSPEPPAARRSPRAVNEPLTFIEFVASHPLGVTVSGIVQAFTSHGAVVSVGDVRCYVPLSGLGEPPPRSAREILRKNEPRDFVVTALDPQRRGVELALPEVAVVSGKPSDETVEAEVALSKPRSRRTSASKTPPAAEGPPRARRRGTVPVEDTPPPSPRKAAVKKAPVSKRPASPAAKTTSKRPPVVAQKSAATTKKTPVVKAAAAPAKKAVAQKAVSGPKGAAPRKAATSAAPKPQKTSAGKTRPAATNAAPAAKKVAPSSKKAAPPAKKAAPAAKKVAPPVKKAPAPVAKKSPATKKTAPVTKANAAAANKAAPAATSQGDKRATKKAAAGRAGAARKRGSSA
jgi:hypothetical protein